MAVTGSATATTLSARVGTRSTRRVNSARQPSFTAGPEALIISMRASFVDAHWRALDYLSVGQIHLLDNPLPYDPLKPDHVKPRPGIMIEPRRRSRTSKSWSSLGASATLAQAPEGSSQVGSALVFSAGATIGTPNNRLTADATITPSAAPPMRSRGR